MCLQGIAHIRLFIRNSALWNPCHYQKSFLSVCRITMYHWKHENQHENYQKRISYLLFDPVIQERVPITCHPTDICSVQVQAKKFKHFLRCRTSPYQGTQISLLVSIHRCLEKSWYRRSIKYKTHLEHE